MHEWKAAVGGSVLLVMAMAALWGVLSSPHPWLFLGIFFPLWVFPLGAALNWSISNWFLRRVQQGLAQAGVPSHMHVQWGFLVVRGASFATPGGPLSLRLYTNNVVVSRPGRPGSMTMSGIAGGQTVGRKLAQMIRPAGALRPA